MRILPLILMFLYHHTIFAQVFTVVDSSQSTVSFRGLSMVNEQVIWVSGSKGTIGKSINGGHTWQWVNPKGFERRDFRDIEAFDEKTAIAMAVDSPGILLKTKDGGLTWKVVYEDHRPGIFLDAMDFAGQAGICLGDPINSHFVLLTTNNQGDGWESIPVEKSPIALPGEACFAASGSNIILLRGKGSINAAFVTGGRWSRLHILGSKGGAHNVSKLPLQQGQQMTGANGLVDLGKHFAIVAGDYNQPARPDSAFFVHDVKGHSTSQNLVSPLGYLSCAANEDNNMLVCGLNGISCGRLSKSGNSVAVDKWVNVTKVPFHVIQISGKTAFAAGPKGRIARINL